MKFSHRIEDGMTVLCIDEADMYSPESEKDRRVTLSALRAEVRRLAKLISMERKNEDKDTLSEYLTAANELIDIYESGREFRLLHIYKDVLLCALENEKKHRKAARRIARDIRSVPQLVSVEIGGVFDFSDLYSGKAV